MWCHEVFYTFIAKNVGYFFQNLCMKQECRNSMQSTWYYGKLTDLHLHVPLPSLLMNICITQLLFSINNLKNDLYSRISRVQSRNYNYPIWGGRQINDRQYTFCEVETVCKNKRQQTKRKDKKERTNTLKKWLAWKAALETVIISLCPCELQNSSPQDTYHLPILSIYFTCFPH